jgi:hypothetical protein
MPMTSSPWGCVTPGTANRHNAVGGGEQGSLQRPTGVNGGAW